MQINITDFTQKWFEGQIYERVINYRYISPTQILYNQLYYSTKEMKEEENNQQRKSFEKSILSEVPKELPLFSLHEANEAFNSLYRGESQKQREVESEPRPIIQPKIEYEEQSDQEDEESVSQQESSNLDENINSIHANNWKKLKKLTRILAELLQQTGQIEIDRLKGLLVDKFQSLFGTLSEKIKTNIGRRYYDAKKILQSVACIKINNDKISLVNDKQENQRQLVLKSKKEFIESERSCQLKRQRAKLLQKSLKTLNNLISRNKKSEAKKIQKMQMPFVTYSMDQNESLASHFKEFSNKKVKAEGKNMQFYDDYELLDYMSQDLMQRPVRKRRM